MIACSVDDFPAPFGPIRPTIWPGSTSSDRPRTASTAPYRTERFSTAQGGHSTLLGGRALAEVGGGDAEVGADLVRRALGERRPLVEHVDPFADVEHESDVVVDEQDAGAAVAHGVDRGREARISPPRADRPPARP